MNLSYFLIKSILSENMYPYEYKILVANKEKYFAVWWITFNLSILKFSNVQFTFYKFGISFCISDNSY